VDGHPGPEEVRYNPDLSLLAKVQRQIFSMIGSKRLLINWQNMAADFL
jgi:hypothetical protein